MLIPLIFITLRGASEIQITLHFGKPSEVITTDLRKPIFWFYIYDLFSTFCILSVGISWFFFLPAVPL